jgi:Ca-activated chloride channel family protein
MSFAWPYAFLFALPLGIAAWRMLRRGRRSGVKFAAVKRLPARTAGWRARIANLTPFLFLAGAALLIVACARPRKPLNRESRNVEAIAIAMTVDVSGSMEALDLSPTNVRRLEDAKTRLDVVKELFAKFVEARPDDLIGLVTFGGYASSLAPLTADHEALLHVLKGVQVPTMSFDANGNVIDPDETMTAVGDGLATALARLKNAETKSRIVILLSDGVSNTGAVEPDDAAAAAKKLGIRVYTIGVGTHSARTPFKARDMFGRTSVQYANMSFDESQLKSIAKTTGARYFGVRDAKGLKAALEEIDSLEKTTLDRTVFQRYREYFPPFLLWGAVLVLAAVSVQMMASRRLV